MLTLIALSALLVQDPPAPPAPPAPPEVHTRFMMMGDGPGGLDKDGDGQVSREEFAAPMNDHFARMDRDGDGRLSTEEMSADHGSGEHVFIRGPGGEGGPGVRHFELRRDGASSEHVETDVRTMIFSGRGEGGPGGEHQIVIRGAGGEGSPRVIHLPRGADGPGEHNVIIRRFGGPDGGREIVLDGPGGEGGARAFHLSRDADGPGDHNVVVRQLGGPDGEQKMDADNDGRISEAEFTGPLREAFTRMDADHSGFIEEGERGQGNDVQVFTHRVETRQDRED